MTIEDETGRIDLIVRRSVYQRYREASIYSSSVVAAGRVERDGGVVHVLVRNIDVLTSDLLKVPAMSRDFR